MPATFPAAERTRLESAARTAIADAVTPSYAKFRAFLTERVHPRRPDHDRRKRPARRRGLLPATRQAVHHAAADARPGARDRAGRGGAHPRRDGDSDAEHRLHRRLRRVPDDAAHRSALLPEDGEQLLKEGVVDRQAHGREAALAVRPPAAAALRRGAGARLPGAQVHGRPVQRQPTRRQRAGLLLAQHLRARDASALQPRGADAARSRARPSPADRAGQ